MAKKETKWKLPPTHKLKSPKELFIKLAEENKSSKSFSHRALAAKLKWPNSYISDIIKGRRKLTIKRCVQLLRYFSADPIDSERLIFLAIGDYFPESSSPVLNLLEKRAAISPSTTQDFSILQMETQLIFDCFSWFKRDVSFEELASLLRRCRIPEAELKATLTLLVSKKFLKKTGDLYRLINRPDIFSEDIGTEEKFFKIHAAYAENFKKLIDPPARPGFINTNFVFLHPDKIKETMEKLFSFRTWLQETSESEIQKATSKDLLLFQFDLNLVPIFDKEVAKDLAYKIT